MESWNDWFGSPYYHQLYAHRDEKEAKYLIDNLLSYLKLEGGRVLDCGCGRGRHSRYLNVCGFDVTGIDLNQQNIDYAKQFQNETLRFLRHDMLNVFEHDAFDLVANFFTSFGYSQTEIDLKRAIAAVAKSLKSGGYYVLDFFNSEYVKEHLIPVESTTIQDTVFHIRRTIDESMIIKDITFVVDDVKHHYEEKIRLITHQEFLNSFEEAGMKLLAIFGDYAMNAFDAKSSERQLFVVQL